MAIADNITNLRNEISRNVKIIAVSKTMPVELINEAYQAGQRVFGENKVQELVQKQPLLPSDIEWHLIGHLQTNKVKNVVPFVKMIHSVDSLKLLSQINTEAGKIDRTIDCLLQLRIAKEETKFGMSFDEAKELLNSDEFRNLSHVSINGLMGIATFTDDANLIKYEFAQLMEYFREIKKSWFSDAEAFKEISMGMSGDYKLAIEAGSTIVRIGSLIFGERNYNK
jgi:pyridoxal phosphate enzyme (YggS family)